MAKKDVSLDLGSSQSLLDEEVDELNEVGKELEGRRKTVKEKYEEKEPTLISENFSFKDLVPKVGDFVRMEPGSIALYSVGDFKYSSNISGYAARYGGKVKCSSIFMMDATNPDKIYKGLKVEVIETAQKRKSRGLKKGQNPRNLR